MTRPPYWGFPPRPRIATGPLPAPGCATPSAALDPLRISLWCFSFPFLVKGSRGEPSKAMIEEELFHRALEKPTLAEHRAFMDQACADQPELRQRVERLLRSHRQEDSFLHAPVTTDE